MIAEAACAPSAEWSNDDEASLDAEAVALGVAHDDPAFLEVADTVPAGLDELCTKP
jgi:hypothetical protein